MPEVQDQQAMRIDVNGTSVLETLRLVRLQLVAKVGTPNDNCKCNTDSPWTFWRMKLALRMATWDFHVPQKNKEVPSINIAAASHGSDSVFSERQNVHFPLYSPWCLGKVRKVGGYLSGQQWFARDVVRKAVGEETGIYPSLLGYAMSRKEE